MRQRIIDLLKHTAPFLNRPTDVIDFAGTLPPSK